MFLHHDKYFIKYNKITKIIIFCLVSNFIENDINKKNINRDNM